MNELERIRKVADAITEIEAESTPSAELVMQRGRHRRVRRRLVGALTVLLPLVVVVTLVALRTNDPSRLAVKSPESAGPTLSSTSTPQVAPPAVPWAPTPGHANSRYEFAQTLPAPQGSWPPCDKGQLHFELHTGRASGAVRAEIAIQNVSTSTCSVEGTPGVVVRDSGGAVIATSDRVSTGTPIVLVPSSWAHTYIGTIFLANCETSVTVAIDLGDGPTIESLPSSTPSNPCAGSTATQLDAQPLEAMEASLGYLEDSGLRHVTLAISVREPVRAGEALHYDVSIRNDGSQDMSLVEPYCPLYSQSLGERAPAVFRLNCGFSGGTTIPSGESVNFAMELAVPPDITSGQQTLHWRLVEPQGPAALTEVDVAR